MAEGSRNCFGLRRTMETGIVLCPGTHLGETHREGVRIGLDGIAQRIVLGVHAVKLPQPGTKMRSGEVASQIICGDKSVPIVCPLDGIVTVVNQTVYRDPSVLHEDTYGEGWLFDMAQTKFPDTCLRHGRSARRWFSAEAGRLKQFLERDLGVAAADGGELLWETPALLSYEQWTALTDSFLLPRPAAATEIVSTSGAETAPIHRQRPAVTLLRAVGGVVAGGLYIIVLPVIGFAVLIWTFSQRLGQLLRSGAAHIATRFSRRPRRKSRM